MAKTFGRLSQLVYVASNATYGTSHVANTTMEALGTVHLPPAVIAVAGATIEITAWGQVSQAGGAAQLLWRYGLLQGAEDITTLPLGRTILRNSVTTMDPDTTSWFTFKSTVSILGATGTAVEWSSEARVDVSSVEADPDFPIIDWNASIGFNRLNTNNPLPIVLGSAWQNSPTTDLVRCHQMLAKVYWPDNVLVLP